MEAETNSVCNSLTVNVPSTVASPLIVKLFVVVREPNIEILPVICESLKIVLPSVNELADTELNTTFDVGETS